MYKHILVALDGSPGSLQALQQATALARLTGATLTALSVGEKLPAYAASVGEVQEAKLEMEAYFSRIQAAAVEQAKAAGVIMDTSVQAGHAAQTIVRFAEEQGFDLVVVGAERRRSLGGTADRVAESAPCSVLIARSCLFSMLVRDVMNREVWTVTPSTPVGRVVELLIERGVKATPVVENGHVVGIITGGDLLRRAGMGLRLSLQRALPAEALAEQVRQLSRSGQTAEGVMTALVVTIRDNARVSDAIQLMTRRHIKRLPVIDAEGALVGIIGRLEVLRLVASAMPEEVCPPAQAAGKARTAGDLMSRDVPTCSLDTALDEVLSKLVTTPLRRVVVVDEFRHVLGLVLDSELLAHLRKREAPGRLEAFISWLSHRVGEPPLACARAEDVMTRPVFTVLPETALAEVAREMLQRQVKRLVVADAEGRLAGIVDRQSLLQALTDAT